VPLRYPAEPTMQQTNTTDKVFVNLRPYQAKAVESVLSAWSVGNKRVLGIAPTGAGKTIIFSALTKEILSQGGRVLILAHRKELLEQTIDKLFRSTGIFSDLEKAEFRARMTSRVVVASVQTLIGNRLRRFEQSHFTHIIVDECHHILADSYQSILGHFNANIVGFTATADRSDRKNLGDFFDVIGFEIFLLDLVNEGYLVMPKTLKASLPPIDLSGVKKVAGDFSASDLDETIEPMLLDAARVIIDTASKYNRKKILGFFPLRKTAEAMSKILNDLGMPSGFVHGEDPDRSDKIKDFSNGKYRFLANAMLLTEGYDEPAVDMVVPMRPTQSRSLYCQIVGRGTRLFPGNIGDFETREDRLREISESPKPDCLILDFPFLSDKLSLIKPAHLVARTAEEAERMTRIIERSHQMTLDIGRVLKAAEQEEIEEKRKVHERELALKARIDKTRGKESKLVDTIQMALDLQEQSLIDYVPIMRWESDPPTPEQISTLEKFGVDKSTVQNKGHAKLLLDTIFARQRMNLATPKQVKYLLQFKHPNPHMATFEEAKLFLASKFGAYRRDA
jgi:superfamily II DNA or RNA helicase